MAFEFSIDWEKELARLLDGYRLVVPTAVVKELSILAEKGTGMTKRKAAASVHLLERYERIETTSQKADDAVIEAAKKTHGVVITNDAELRKRLKQNSIPIVFLRGKKRLVLEE